jgi:hypothetical protein
MARTRAKFQCLSVTDHGWNKTVRLQVVYSRVEGTENYDFTKATPSGTVEMTIDNPAAAVQFVPQRYYYVDFEECPEEQQPNEKSSPYQKKDFKHKPENLNPA